MNKHQQRFALAGVGLFLVLSAAWWLWPRPPVQQDPVVNPPAPAGTIALTPAQSRQVKVVAAGRREFVAQREAVGYIDFNQDRTVQVFSPWAGRIHEVFVKAGDTVRRGSSLYSIDSPDLVQAQSTLIATAGALQLTTRALERARKMLEIQASAQKDVDQAASDQQTAEANYKAARNAVKIFGKSDAEVEAVVSQRHTDGLLRVTSPLDGQVTARNGSPGLLVQPGNAPAPVTVADLSTLWMVASVTEYDLPLLRLGQEVQVKVPAYPGRVFHGRISNIAAAVDAATHRIAVRSELRDPQHELRAQMLATYIIRTGEPVPSIAVPIAGIVREGDGSMTVFVTHDGRHFERRAVQLGQEQDGQIQVLAGLNEGEQVATDGALFLSNALSLQQR